MIINPANLAELQIEIDAAWNAALKAAGTPGENSMADALLYRKIAHGKRKVEYPWRTTQPRMQKVAKGNPKVKQAIAFNRLTVESGYCGLVLEMEELDLLCDDIGLYIDAAREAGGEYADFHERYCASLITDGFATQDGDGQGKYFFDTARKVTPDLGAKSATFDNKLVDVLGGTGFGKARKGLMAMSYGDGKPRGIGNRGFTLICGPANQDAAEELLLAEKTTGGKSNIYYKKADLIVSSYLGTSTAWALVAKTPSTSARPMIWQESVPLLSRMSGTDGTPAIVEGKVLFERRCFGEHAYGDPQLIVGSTGAGA
jgi:phage major head subunit gpT-like protein